MKKTVLVVDDDASVRKSLSKVLKEAGYEVVLARDGQEAVQRFDPHQTDLLVLDIGLPIKNGWETFERITSEDPVLPIIVITGQTEQYDTAVMAGAGALMEKPLDAPQLLETIEELLAEPKDARLRRLCGYQQDVRHIPSDSSLFLQKLREQSSSPFRCTLSANAENP
jgi:DNA-binding response OmpR family regulator